MSLEPAFPAKDELLDIGGRRLHVKCIGYGPTIVCEAGMGDTLDTWALVLQSLAEVGTVVSYDRAGIGRSDPAPLPRTVQDMAADLYALLTVASIPGPYVLVGHSFGAQVVRLFAARRSTEVKGMVLVDPSHEDKYERFESALSDKLINRQNTFLRDPSRNSEHVDLLESRSQMHAAHEVLDAPLVVLSRGKPDEPSSIWPAEALQNIEMRLHHELLNIAGAGSRRHIIARYSGHYIHQDDPDLVASAVREIVETTELGG